MTLGQLGIKAQPSAKCTAHVVRFLCVSRHTSVPHDFVLQSRFCQCVERSEPICLACTSKWAKILNNKTTRKKNWPIERRNRRERTRAEKIALKAKFVWNKLAENWHKVKRGKKKMSLPTAVRTLRPNRKNHKVQNQTVSQKMVEKVILKLFHSKKPKVVDTRCIIHIQVKTQQRRSLLMDSNAKTWTHNAIVFEQIGSMRAKCRTNLKGKCLPCAADSEVDWQQQQMHLKTMNQKIGKKCEQTWKVWGKYVHWPMLGSMCEAARRKTEKKIKQRKAKRECKSSRKSRTREFVKGKWEHRGCG